MTAGLLPQPPKGWNHRCVLLCLFSDALLTVCRMEVMPREGKRMGLYLLSPMGYTALPSPIAWCFFLFRPQARTALLLMAVFLVRLLTPMLLIYFSDLSAKLLKGGHTFLVFVLSFSTTVWHMVGVFIINRSQLWSAEARDSGFVRKILLILQNWLQEWRLHVEEKNRKQTSGPGQSQTEKP